MHVERTGEVGSFPCESSDIARCEVHSCDLGLGRMLCVPCQKRRRKKKRRGKGGGKKKGAKEEELAIIQVRHKLSDLKECLAAWAVAGREEGNDSSSQFRLSFHC